VEVKYLFDTNIFLYHLAGIPKIQKFFSEKFLVENEVVTSRIVRLELLSLPGLSSSKANIIREMLDQFTLIPITEDIEELTISSRQRYRIKLPDALIAATAYQTSSILVTHDVKDFKRIVEIRSLNPFF